jgi:hypothetical protein
LKAHYDFDYSKAKPNRFAKMQDDKRRASRGGHEVTIHKPDGTTIVRHIPQDKDAVFLDPDVREYFSDSESVNEALRGLIALVPQKRRTRSHARS